jgi:hypothetical protein
MKKLARVGLIVAAFSGLNASAQMCSVLPNINCGSGTPSCFQQKETVSGAVRCICTATCLSPYSITNTVAATSAVQWGQKPGKVCASPLTGAATGGGAVGNHASIVSGVFAETTLQGALIANTMESLQHVDCFASTMANDPPIIGVC